NLSLALSGTRSVDVVTDGSLTLGGVISGAGHGITKSGGGLLTLGAANTFSGAVTINAGRVSASSDGKLRAAPSAPTAGKIVLNNGAFRATAIFTVNANRGVDLGGEGTFETGNGI